jgi:hypothetical protein
MKIDKLPPDWWLEINVYGNECVLAISGPECRSGLVTVLKDGPRGSVLRNLAVDAAFEGGEEVATTAGRPRRPPFYTTQLEAELAALRQFKERAEPQIAALEAALDEAVHDWRDTKVWWQENSAIGRAARFTAQAKVTLAPVLETHCSICNAPFSTWERHLNGRDIRTCSDKCAALYYSSSHPTVTV